VGVTGPASDGDRPRFRALLERRLLFGGCMRWLDSLLGRGAPVIAEPDRLRDALLEAASAGTRRRLASLCRANWEAVARAFPSWRTVPEPLRADRHRTRAYVHGLIAVAEVFEHDLGDPSLLRLLEGPGESNPLVRWQEALGRAREQIEALEYREAARALEDLLIDVRGMCGSGSDRYLPVTYGSLGECFFQAGEAGRALGPLEQALGLCERQGDAEGVVAYLRNLYEAQRYLGQPGPAADRAEGLARALAARGRQDEAAWFGKQARLVRAGEPLNRVVAAVGARRYELDELPPIGDGRVQFQFERNRVSLRPCAVLCERGKQLGSEGRYEEALAWLRQAAQADRHDPHPYYLAGLTLLYLGRHAEAIESYEATEERAPGWFHCRADLWLARELALGRLDQAAFLALTALEDAPLPADQKVELARRLLDTYPGLALVYLHLGRNLEAMGRRDEAEAAYREGLTGAGEPDVRTRLLVQLGNRVPAGPDRDGLLREAVELRGNLVASATALILLRRSAP
jgi:tetratricopeptide (TPR) repeat protein